MIYNTVFQTLRASMFRSQELTDSSTRDTEGLRPRPRDGWEVEGQLQKNDANCEDFKIVSTNLNNTSQITNHSIITFSGSRVACSGLTGFTFSQPAFNAGEEATKNLEDYKTEACGPPLHPIARFMVKA